MKIAIKLNNPDFVNVFEDILQVFLDNLERNGIFYRINNCLLYTSDAADE